MKVGLVLKLCNPLRSVPQFLADLPEFFLQLDSLGLVHPGQIQLPIVRVGSRLFLALGAIVHSLVGVLFGGCSEVRGQLDSGPLKKS